VNESASRRVASRRVARAETRAHFRLVTAQPDLVADIDFVARDVVTRASSRRDP
jgi:hypothetical protein